MYQVQVDEGTRGNDECSACEMGYLDTQRPIHSRDCIRFDNAGMTE